MTRHINDTNSTSDDDVMDDNYDIIFENYNELDDTSWNIETFASNSCLCNLERSLKERDK